MPIWYDVLRFAQGTRETVGAQSNPLILEWAKFIGLTVYKEDSTAWCALVMNAVLKTCGLPMAGDGKDQYNRLRAMQFATWGQPVPVTKGAVLVFGRKGGGHVGLSTGRATATQYEVLGGNQGDAVSVALIDKSRLVASRWPSGVTQVINTLVPVTGVGVSGVSET